MEDFVFTNQLKVQVYKALEPRLKSSEKFG